MVQFEGILIFDSWLFVSFFCLGIFGVCTFMYACGEELMHSPPTHTQKIKKFIVHITEKKQSRASRAEGSESEQLHQGWGETGSLESLPTGIRQKRRCHWL